MALESLLASLKGGVAEVSGVQAASCAVPSETSLVSRGVSGVTVLVPPVTSETRVTPEESSGLQAKPLPLLPCTLETPATRKSNEAESRNFRAEDVATAENESAIRAWLVLIDENDPVIVADVLERSRRDPHARGYFIGQAVQSNPSPFPDDRRTCNQCANLSGLQCEAAKRGEIAASASYNPIKDVPMRCEGYVPGADDPDRRHGRDRWPGLSQEPLL